MTLWSRDTYALVLAYIGAALVVFVVFVLGVAVVLATGHSVPPAFWAVGGVAMGILTGLLLPRPGPPTGTLNSGGTPDDRSSTRPGGEEPRPTGSTHGPNEPDAVVEPAGDEPTPPPQPTPLVLVFVLAAVAVLGLTLSVLLYAGQIHRAGCEPIGVAGTPGCETPLLDLADAFIFIASSAAGALLGIFVPRPATPQTPAESAPAPAPDVAGEARATTSGAQSTPAVTTTALQLSGGLLAALAGIVLLLLPGLVLLALLPRATVDLARLFHIGSLGLIVVTVALAVVAVASPPGKKQAWVLTAVVTAVLAFISSTASGLVVDRFTNHPTGPSPVATVKNYFSPTVRPPSVKNYFSPTVRPASVNVDVGAECAVYLVHLDDLVDDEPHIADHLPGRSFPLDQGARACGLKRASEVNAIAAVLAAR